MAGGLAVLLTAALYALVIIVAGVEDFRIVATLGFAVHIPLAGIEAVIVGVAAGYLARVKPEMLCSPSPLRGGGWGEGSARRAQNPSPPTPLPATGRGEQFTYFSPIAY